MVWTPTASAGATVLRASSRTAVGRSSSTHARYARGEAGVVADLGNVTAPLDCFRQAPRHLDPPTSAGVAHGLEGQRGREHQVEAVAPGQVAGSAADLSARLGVVAHAEHGPYLHVEDCGRCRRPQAQRQLTSPLETGDAAVAEQLDGAELMQRSHLPDRHSVRLRDVVGAGEGRFGGVEVT